MYSSLRSKLSVIYLGNCLVLFLIISLNQYTKTVWGTPKLNFIGLKTPFRYDYQGEIDANTTLKSRYQLQISSDLEIGLSGTREHGLQLMTLIGSGDHFTSQWSTLYDQKTHEQKPLELAVRQLYLHYVNHIGRLSFGVIPPVKEFVSNTSMDSDGWIRGARVVIYVGQGGELEAVTGAVDRLNQPSVFQSPTRWNYHELEWTQAWWQNLRTELGAMLLTKSNILRSELRYGFNGVFNSHVEISGELLHDFKVKRIAYDLMLQIKKNDYRLRLEYSSIDEQFGMLGTLVNDYFSLGTVTMVAIDGPTYLGKFKWFTRIYRSDTVQRGMLGLGYPLKLNFDD